MDAKENRPPHFRDVLRDAVRREYGTQKAFALALGVSEAQVSQYYSGSHGIQPSTLDNILRAFTSEAHRHALYKAWAGQFEPTPLLPKAASPAEVLAQIEGLFEKGLIRPAIRLAERELTRTDDYEKWFKIAERLEPLYLRLGNVSTALTLRDEIERRATEQGDMLAVLAALAMTETALQSLDAATLAAVDDAHRRSLAAAERWTPVTSESKRVRELRIASLSRTRALQILAFFKKGKISSSSLETALKEAGRAYRLDHPPYMVANGLETTSRIQAASGQLFQAEETIEELDAFGLGHGWEMWEKSRLTLARIAEARGERDEAVRILTEVRDRCRALDNLHHARTADQELARLMLGL